MTAPPTSASLPVDYVRISFEALDLLDGDFAAAFVWQRIVWRAQAEFRDGWWRATVDEVATDCHVSLKTAKRVLAKLKSRGWLETRQERAEHWDHTISYRPVFRDQSIGTVRDQSIGTAEDRSDGTVRDQSSMREDSEDNLEDTSSADADATRGDVEALCVLLADRIAQNGSRRPTITKAWRTACRLLIDRDGRTPDQIAKAIDWCQSDEFWRSNILSMPTLRARYDQMRLQACRAKPNSEEARRREWDEALAEAKRMRGEA